MTYTMFITLVENEKAVDVQQKEQSTKESVQNPIYAGEETAYVC